MNKSETLRKKLSKKHLDVSFQFLIYFAGTWRDSTHLMVFHFIHRLDCLIKRSNVAFYNTAITKGSPLEASAFSSASTPFPTFSQASDMVFWNLTVDFMPSKINATLSWLLPAAGFEAGLF